MVINTPSADNDRTYAPKPTPAISERPIKEKTSPTLVFGVIVGLIVLVVLGMAITYRTTMIYSSNDRTQTTMNEVVTETDTRETLSSEERDQQRLDDIEMLLTSIKKYKETGDGNGIYFPRNLMEAVPQEHKQRIYRVRQEARYGYKQTDGGTNFALLIPLETSKAHNQYASDSVGRNTVRFTKESDTYKNIVIRTGVSR